MNSRHECTPSRDAASFIAALPVAEQGQPPAAYEFSVQLSHGRLARWGRFAVWLSGEEPHTYRPIARWLETVMAPQEVIQAHASAVQPVSQAVAIALTRDGPEFRLYLHGRDPATRHDIYEGLRWRPDGAVRRSTYHFHFAPETPDGQDPAALAPMWVRESYASLTAEPRWRACSGFWLRYAPDRTLEQIDLAFPWLPAPGALPGLGQLIDTLALPAGERAWLDALPVRHVAVHPAHLADQDERTLTLYVSAVLDRAPADEAQLQAAVIAAARPRGTRVLALLNEVQPAPEAPRCAGSEACHPAQIDGWRAVLGEPMHHHHGMFELPCTDPDDQTMLTASRKAVSDLYPFIEPGARVYDVGCGWGGALDMLCRERHCHALGVTRVRTQFRHVASRGLPVRWADAVHSAPPGRFDVALLLESLEHIQDKLRLLTMLRLFVSRLVMRVNCQEDRALERASPGSVHPVSPQALETLLATSGWRVRHWRERREEALPSLVAWRRRISQLGPGADRELETWRAWLDGHQAVDPTWQACNPLIEIVAE